MLYYILCILSIISINTGQYIYQQSSDCPGTFKWNKTATTVLGGFGIGPNQLAYPNGIFIEPKTKILYIVDVGNHRVQKRYENGEVVTAAGQANGTGGSTADTLKYPADVFADENENVFVADFYNQRIQYWLKDAKSGKTVAGNGSYGPALNEFSYPSRLLVDSRKEIMVVDSENNRVTQWTFPYDPEKHFGEIIAGGNGAGLNPYQLSYPTGIYYDEDNEIFYISNEDAHSIIQWYIGSFDRHYIYAGIPGRPGNSSIQLNHPQGITVDKHGNLYVADTLNNRIQMFCPQAVEGITIAGATQVGNSSEELNNPRDITFDSEMNLYVSDSQNSRIQKFQRIL